MDLDWGRRVAYRTESAYTPSKKSTLQRTSPRPLGQPAHDSESEVSSEVSSDEEEGEEEGGKAVGNTPQKPVHLDSDDSQ